MFLIISTSVLFVYIVAEYMDVSSLILSLISALPSFLSAGLRSVPCWIRGRIRISGDAPDSPAVLCSRFHLSIQSKTRKDARHSARTSFLDNDIVPFFQRESKLQICCKNVENALKDTGHGVRNEMTMKMSVECSRVERLKSLAPVPLARLASSAVWIPLDAVGLAAASLIHRSG